MIVIVGASLSETQDIACETRDIACETQDIASETWDIACETRDIACVWIFVFVGFTRPSITV